MTAQKKWAERGKVRYMSGAYDSLHGDGTIKMAREIDANLVLLSFTGTAGEREKWNWKLVKPFVERAHENGLKVSFYMKLTNIQWMQLFDERPESKDWIMVYQNGTPALYGRDPSRFMGCLNNPGWRDYLKEMIGEAVAHGADGLFYDNCFIPRELKGSTEEGAASGWACYCDTCRELFKSYTKESLGWACALPPEPDWDNPVWQAFIDFRDKTLEDVTRMVVSHAKGLNPDIVVYPNVCPPWSGGGGAKGSTTNQIADIVDILLFEGDTQPRLVRVGGLSRPHNAAVDWKYASALVDKPVFSRAHTSDNVHTADRTMLGIAESFAFGGAYQIVVAGMLARQEDKREGVKRYYAFVKRNEGYYTDVESVADVAILMSTPTVNWYYPDRVAQGSEMPKSIQGMAQALVELHVPFDVVLDRDLAEAAGPGYRVLVAPGVACMSDDQADAVARFVERGGGLIATGVTSLYDERYRIRQDFGLAEVFGLHYGEEAGGVVKSSFGEGLSAYLPGSPEETFWHEAPPGSLHVIEEALAYTLRDHRQIEVNAPSTTVINLTRKRSTGTTILHLVNYEPTRPAKDISVRLRKPEGKSLDNVRALSPDLDETVLEAEESEQTVSFVVPLLLTYDLVAIDWK